MLYCKGGNFRGIRFCEKLGILPLLVGDMNISHTVHAYIISMTWHMFVIIFLSAKFMKIYCHRNYHLYGATIDPRLAMSK